MRFEVANNNNNCCKQRQEELREELAEAEDC